MPKETWIIAGVLTAALLLGLLGYSTWDKKRRVDQAQADAVEIRASLERARTQNEELKHLVGLLEQQVSQLQKEKESVVQTHRSLEDDMRAALESKDVTISQLQGKLTVNILDRVLFESGEADLKPDGQAVLRKVGSFLADHPRLKVHVIGHTDNVPIRAAARSRFPSNWELSTARATAAVRFLVETAGVDPRRLGVVGYGEFRPAADNSTPEGRARNRRIAITILSEEIVGADPVPAGPGAVPAGATNNPPEALPSAPPEESESAQ